MRRRHQEGFVLVCVLWILAILTVISVGFGRRAWMEARAASLEMDHLQAKYWARSAAVRGLAALQNKATVDTLQGKILRTSYDQQCFNPKDMLEEGIYFAASEDPEFENDACIYVIRDEESRISVNHAPMVVLKKINGFNMKVINAIKQRRGLERRGRPPHAFLTIEEVHDLGIDDDIWYGNEDTPGVRELLTVRGDGYVNLNTASADVLRCLPEVPDNIIDAIIEYRDGDDDILGTEDDHAFRDFGAVLKKVKITGKPFWALQRFCKYTSSFYTITGFATRRQGKVRAYCTPEVAETSLTQWKEGASAW